MMSGRHASIPFPKEKWLENEFNSSPSIQEKSEKSYPWKSSRPKKWLEALNNQDMFKLEVVNGYHQHQVNHKKKRTSLSIESWLFIGILIMVYYNHHITGQFFIPHATGILLKSSKGCHRHFFPSFPTMPVPHRPYVPTIGVLTVDS